MQASCCDPRVALGVEVVCRTGAHETAPNAAGDCCRTWLRVMRVKVALGRRTAIEFIGNNGLAPLMPLVPFPNALQEVMKCIHMLMPVGKLLERNVLCWGLSDVLLTRLRLRTSPQHSSTRNLT